LVYWIVHCVLGYETLYDLEFYKTKAPFATQNKIGSDLRKIHQNECITENLMIYDGYLNMFVTNEQGISNGQSYYI
jgi:hypothetical protein